MAAALRAPVVRLRTATMAKPVTKNSPSRAATPVSAMEEDVAAGVSAQDMPDKPSAGDDNAWSHGAPRLAGDQQEEVAPSSQPDELVEASQTAPMAAQVCTCDFWYTLFIGGM